MTDAERLEKLVEAKDAWLNSVEAIDPEIAKPELWTSEHLNTIFPPDNKPLIAHLDRMVKSLIPATTTENLVGSLLSVMMLGYLMGQQSIRKLN